MNLYAGLNCSKSCLCLSNMQANLNGVHKQAHQTYINCKLSRETLVIHSTMFMVAERHWWVVEYSLQGRSKNMNIKLNGDSKLTIRPVLLYCMHFCPHMWTPGHRRLSMFISSCVCNQLEILSTLPLTPSIVQPRTRVKNLNESNFCSSCWIKMCFCNCAFMCHCNYFYCKINERGGGMGHSQFLRVWMLWLFNGTHGGIFFLRCHTLILNTQTHLRRGLEVSKSNWKEPSREKSDSCSLAWSRRKREGEREENNR